MSEEKFSFGAKRGAAAYMLYTSQYKKNCRKLWQYLGSEDLHLTLQDLEDVIALVCKLQKLLESSPKEFEKLLSQRIQAEQQKITADLYKNGNSKKLVRKLTKIKQRMKESEEVLKLFNELQARYFSICKEIDEVIMREEIAIINCNAWLFIISKNNIKTYDKNGLPKYFSEPDIVTFNNI